MIPLLLDANLSPETAAYLRTAFGIDVIDLATIGLDELSDEDVVALARNEGRVIVSFDLDMGEIFHRQDGGPFGLILLRLENQTVESVNRVLDRFFRVEALTIPLSVSLVVLDEVRTRVILPR